jgi:hypothetical protein
MRLHSATLLKMQVKESNLRLFAIAKRFDIKLTCATKIINLLKNKFYFIKKINLYLQKENKI